METQITAGEIARRTRAELHRVIHILSTRQVVPIARAGVLRIFDEAAVELVRRELAKQDAKRSRRQTVAA